MNLQIGEIILLLSTTAGLVWRLSVLQSQINHRASEQKQELYKEVSAIEVKITKLVAAVEKSCDSDTSEIRYSEQRFQQITYQIKEIQWKLDDVREYLIKSTDFKARKSPYK